MDSHSSHTANDCFSLSNVPGSEINQWTLIKLFCTGLKLTLQTKRRANSSGDDGKKKTRKEDGSGADDEEEDEASNNNKSSVSKSLHFLLFSLESTSRRFFSRASW